MTYTYIFRIYLICTALAILPSIFWFFFWWIKDNQKEPPKLILKCVIVGMISATILIPFRTSFIGMHWGYIIIIASVTEELLKISSQILIFQKNYKFMDQVIDGIIYSVSIAMGFAFIENIVYLSETLITEGFNQIFFLTYGIRSMITTFAHGVFTSVFGLTYAYSYLYPNNKNFSKKHIFPLIINIITLRIIFGKTLKREYPIIDKNFLFVGRSILSAVLCVKEI